MSAAERDFPHHFRPPDPADAVDIPLAADKGLQAGPRPPRPWYQLIGGQWPLFVSLLGVTAGLVVTSTGHWKRGTTLIGATFVLATLLRAVLPERLVGLLQVRGRAWDTLILGVLGVGILVLALVVPPTQK